MVNSLCTQSSAQMCFRKPYWHLTSFPGPRFEGGNGPWHQPASSAISLGHYLTQLTYSKPYRVKLPRFTVCQKVSATLTFEQSFYHVLSEDNNM